jgi:hypothetical protein
VDQAQPTDATQRPQLLHAMHPTSAGSVVLDIGGTTGALVVRAPTGSVGDELEIRQTGGPWRGDHVAVRRRIVADQVFAAALFGPLRAGTYQVRWRSRPPGSEPVVEIRPGTVTEVEIVAGPLGEG